jgi:flagellar basal-body rod protein FlgB
MLEKLFETPAFSTAQGALDGISARHSAISDNIANVNTPGYKRKRVDFEDALRRHVERRSNPCSGTLCSSEPFVPTMSRDTDTMGRADGNNVDIEREMVELSDNALRYEVLSQYVGGTFTGLKAAINGGR